MILDHLAPLALPLHALADLLDVVAEWVDGRRR